MTSALNEGLIVFDDDGNEVVIPAGQVDELLLSLKDLSSVTVSACPACRSRVVACLALIETAFVSSHPSTCDLVDLAEEAPTLHLYVFDADTTCRHRGWHDPGFEEWSEAVEEHLASTRCIS